MESRANYSWVGKLITGVLLAFIGVAATAVLIQLGTITVIVGDGNKVETGSQTQTATRPVDARSAATTQPISDQSISQAQPTVTPESAAATVAQNSTPWRASPASSESDEDCVCPSSDDDEDGEDTTEAEPVPYTRRVFTNNNVSNREVEFSNSSQSQAQSSVSVQGRNISVQTSATRGQTRTRIVINGKVVVDQ